MTTPADPTTVVKNQIKNHTLEGIVADVLDKVRSHPQYVSMVEEVAAEVLRVLFP